jgi:thiol-disulfide isomerase/thioredoxin
MSRRKGTPPAARARKPEARSKSKSAVRNRRAAAAAGSVSPWRRWALPGAAGVLIVAIIVAIVIGNSHGSSTGQSSGSASGETALSTSVGSRAPQGSFTTTTGARQSVSSLRGDATLIWFVTTWCSSCAAGTQAMASNIGKLAANHVRVVEVENAKDLGQEGMSMTSFASRLAGRQVHNPDWTFGVASSALTRTYNPSGYLDIYYLLTPSGRIAFVNSSPAATMGQLLGEASRVSSGKT